ncbi:hypothetical protein Glove_557g59 [Diversispora epigaea]|uniref:Uncharacterized protein n=1 Tax=Diversispora epigaea TaxID=1348612 RepID=A0A397GFE0_9GLOM|nr:hypothetical protein Glove_557g59 [Diversispora epigaea]
MEGCYDKIIGETGKYDEIDSETEAKFRWYRRSAKRGYSDAQFNLGYCYSNGIGTMKDEEEGFQCYLNSAEGGNPKGQNGLGYCYKYGFGITKYEGKAFHYFLESANGGIK